MRTVFTKLKSLLFSCFILPLCYACNDDNDETNGHSPFSSSLGIKIAVIDKMGNEVISKLQTVMPYVKDYWFDETSKGLDPKEYTLELYMDKSFVHSMTNPTEQIDWHIVKEPKANGYPWWSITLPSFHAGELMLAEGTIDKGHAIEYHMQNESLFGDKETHIIRFEYKPFGINTQGLGFYADVSFDGDKVETYYPESYKINAASKGIKLDIEDKYWIEGAIGWPIAIINLRK